VPDLVGSPRHREHRHRRRFLRDRRALAARRPRVQPHGHELRCSLPLGTLFSCPTIRELAQSCRGSHPAKRFTSLVALTGGDGPGLYIVPGVFGNVVSLADLARALRGHPVYGLQSSGLDGSHDVLPTIEQQAGHYIEEIRAVQPRGPYAFGGVCYGATVAYEMARQMLEAGEQIACLVLINPTLRGGAEADRAVRSLPRPVARAAAAGMFVWDRIALYREQIGKLPLREQLPFIAAKLRVAARRVAAPGALDVRREMNARAVLRGNLAALDRYSRRPLPGDVRLVVFIESERGRDSREQHIDDWSRSWKGNVVRHVVAGDKSREMLSERNAQRVAAIVAQHLDVAFNAAAPASRARRAS
jgi:acetoacetyl-CoA synthetase